MDKTSFETKMKKFFEKAGVTLLEKGVEYIGGEETASYILADHKRKSFYLMESDVFDEKDGELDAITDYFIRNYHIQSGTAKATLRLGRAGLFYDDDFAVSGFDLAPMIRKSAFVISESNAEAMTEFLKRRSITFQAVPFKGEFLVMFMDRTNSKKIANLYHKIADEYLKISSEQPLKLQSNDGGSQLIDEIEKAVRENQILFDIDKDDEKHISVEPITHEELPSDDNFKSATDGVEREYFQEGLKEVYSKKPEDNSFIDEFEQRLKDMGAKTPSTPSASAARHLDKKENKGKEFSPEKTGYMVWDNLRAAIFFLPTCILSKISMGKLPTFAIYFISAVIIFFGCYQFLFSSFWNSFYDGALIIADKAAIGAAGLMGGSSTEITFENAAAARMMNALSFFTGEIYFIDYLRNGAILKYLLFVGSFLMIFPFGRKLGGKLSIFCILLYFTLPALIHLQTWVINASVYGTLPMVKSAMVAKNTAVLSGVVASAVSGAVYILPIIFVVIGWLFSAFINPFKQENESEAMP